MYSGAKYTWPGSLKRKQMEAIQPLKQQTTYNFTLLMKSAMKFALGSKTTKFMTILKKCPSAGTVNILVIEFW